MTNFARQISLVLVLAVVSASTLAAMGPKQQVEDSVGKIITTLQNKTLDRETKWKAIGEVVYERFDFRSMSQSILATNWKSATDDEKQKFIDYFSQYLEGVYREKIEAYTNQHVEFIGETIVDDRASVDTVIVTSSTRIPVTYRMKDNDGEWFVYDVVIEGVGLVNNYRNTFAEIVKSDGMEGLLAEIKANIDANRSEFVLQRQAAE